MSANEKTVADDPPATHTAPVNKVGEDEVPVIEQLQAHSNEDRKDDVPVPTPQDFLSLPLPVA